jgi:SET domain-containing protein
MKIKNVGKNQKKLVIKHSKKHGLGVFTTSTIKKGDVVKILDGEIITFDECIERIKAGTEDQSDSLQVGFELDMDLDEISRSINHSCNPNACMRKISELVALKDISKGEEITYDYSATIGPNIPKNLWTMNCNCGATNCRKIIGNVLSIPKRQLEIYRKSGALQDFIKRELQIIKDNKGILPRYRKIKL